MRSIALVEKLVLDYKGTIFQNALCLVDVDNDGFNELCVGFTNGELHVYKGIENSKPWKSYKDLGSLIVLCGGNIRSSDEVLLCALDSEGRCRLFDVAPGDESGNVSVAGSYVSSRPSSPCSNELRLVHQEQLHANAKVAILEDIDNDGVAELVVGFTDRFVRIYKWQVDECPNHFGESVIHSKPTTTTTATNNNQKNSMKNSVDVDRKSTLSFSLSLSKDHKQKENKELCTTPSVTGAFNDRQFPTPGLSDVADDCGKFNSPYHPVGKFVLMKQFSLLGQIGSLAVCKADEGFNQLIVSQPNGGYCVLGQYDKESGFIESLVNTPTNVESPNFTVQESYPTFYPITSNAGRTTHHVNTEIIGGIKRQKKLTGVIGLCTQDGNFIVLDNTYFSGSNPVKNRSDNHWFVMSKLDVTKDGDDEIVLCSMDGMTYIIDKNRDIVSYNFNEYVAAFCAGYYGINGDVNKYASPCVCYVTLSGKIYLYYDLWIDTMKVKCVHTALIKKIKQKPELHYLLDLFKQSNGDIDHQKLQNLLKNINKLVV